MLATSDPALAFAGVPTIPVRVWREEGQWRKQPLTEWDRATTDEDHITAWGRKWLDARPGVPLAKVGWAWSMLTIRSARRSGKFGRRWARVGRIRKVRTVSGGCHFVFAQPPEPISRKCKWCEGVEILGTSCLAHHSRHRRDPLPEGGSEGGVAEGVLEAVGSATREPH